MANIENLSLPLLFPTITEKWSCQSWNFDYLSEILDSKLFSCRVSEKSCGQKMETHYDYHMITIKQFNEWLHDDSRDGPLVDYCREKYSCYIDYKYMKDMFSDVPHIFKEVQWRDFGLQDFDGYDSTIWLGSEGANTPGHQDTYGFNLVVQIYGRKLWILFPPEDSRYLYPTRIPYEESSIFTLVNLRNPDLTKHPKFKFTHPVIVELCPGQTLYVPRHWWHYVESLEPSISVNIWVPLKVDCQSHVTEAVTRCLITGLLPTLDLSENNLMKANWINPKETLDSMDVNLAYLNTALSLLMKSKREITENRHHVVGEIIERKFQETPKEQSTEIDKENSSAASLCQDPEVQLPGKDYLKILYTKLTTMSVKQGPSPFCLCYGNKSHIKRKSSSIRCIAKIQKQSPHQIPSDETDKKETFDKNSEILAFEIHCDAKQQSDNSDKNLDVSALQCGSKRDLSVIYALSSCSVKSYLTFVHDLCQKNNCQCLAGRAEASNVATANSLTNHSHGSTAPQLEFPDSWKGEQDLQSKEPQINRAQTFSLFHSDSQTVETDLDSTEQLETRVKQLLDEQDIAENLLACVLHPDVVNRLSEKLVEMCLESNKS
ncbi:HSPB1-associated protein 1 [Biomphalaria glabrata]|nr:HSPB1-associated protein 1-like [Biomphalaria glabrata]